MSGSCFLKHLKNIASVGLPKIENVVGNSSQPMNCSTPFGSDGDQSPSALSVGLPPNSGEYQMITFTGSNI